MNNERRNRINLLITQLTDMQVDIVAEGKAPIESLRTKVSNAWTELVSKAEELHQQLVEAFDDLKSQCDELAGEVEQIKDEEQEAYDNMPEGLQQGERGQQASEAIENLDNALTALREIADFNMPDLELPDMEDVLGNLDTASDGLDSAAQS